VEQHLRLGEPGWLLEQERFCAVDGLRPDADEPVPVADGEQLLGLVGAGRLKLPQVDNRHGAEVLIAVLPDQRRRGVGRLLDGEAERRTRGHGRDTLLGYADEPPTGDGGAVVRGAAAALGWRVAQVDVRRDVDLPLDPLRCAELEAACRPHAADYDLRTWWDSTPEELLDDRARLDTDFSVDVPKDELDWREEVWDGARLRREEARDAAMGQSCLSAGAVHRSTGRLVAFTEVGLPRADPRRAFQWGTMVAGAHRGHRLGLLLKLLVLQELAAASPATRYVSTWNAQENGHMIAVNDALGARTNGHVLALQRKLG
jgi:GNAT superfamily N-acetyltransferase